MIARILSGVVAIILGGTIASAATLVNYDPTGPRKDDVPLPPSSVHADLTASDLSQSKPDGFENTNVWPNAIVPGALDPSDYVTFTLTPAAKSSVTLDQVEWDGFVYKTTVVTVTARTSVDGFAADAASVTVLGPSLQLATLDLSAVPAVAGQALEVRLYFHGTTASDDLDWYDLLSSARPPSKGLTVTGSVIPAPVTEDESWTFTHFAGSEGGRGAIDGEGSAARFNSPGAVAADGNGNVYVADTFNHTIRKISAEGDVSTLAGVAEQVGSADGTGSAARFFFPYGVAADSTGNVYVADSFNDIIRKITPGGVVTTLAGSTQSGSADGTGSEARFFRPSGVATDSTGNVYVADTYNHTIRKITSAGVVTTLAGLAGQAGSTDGMGSVARFFSPAGIATDSGGNVYVADRSNQTIRKITPGGMVTTLAGVAGQYANTDGTGSAARFHTPSGIATDSNGNVYVADQFNDAIRKITPDGAVTTMAGGTGSADGTGSAARFAGPSGVATDGSGNIYVADTFNQAIRKIAPGVVVTTLAGAAVQYGSTDATGSAARFGYVNAVATDSGGYVYVADSSDTIRKITPGGVVTTLAGAAGQTGSVDGTGSAARFGYPYGIATDASGNVYVADLYNNMIRKVTPGGVVTTLAGALQNGSANGTGSAARFAGPSGVATDGSGNVYVADAGNNTIRKITPGGVVTTLAGAAGQSGSADGTGSAARFSLPQGVATDRSGNLYVADTLNQTIRKIAPGGVVTTLAGAAGQAGIADGTGSAARFIEPRGVAADSSGNVYVADASSHTIRKITPEGMVTTVGGVAIRRGSADGTGSAARFYSPEGVAIDSSGNVWVADRANGSIRVGRRSLADVAMVDSVVGFPGATRLLLTDPDNATSWKWSVIRRPADSVAMLSSDSVRNPTFTPDKPGLFTFRLVAGLGEYSSITTVDLDVLDVLRRRPVRLP